MTTGNVRNKAVALLALACVLLALQQGAGTVRGDHADGNMTAQVNYWLVEEGALRVCDSRRISLAHTEHTGRRNPAPP